MAKQEKFGVDPRKDPRKPTPEEILAQEGDAGMTVGRKAQLARAGYNVSQPREHRQKHEQSG